MDTSTVVVLVVAVALLACAAALALGARARRQRPVDRERQRAEQQAREALEDARSAARILVEKARLEVVQLREAALDELRAREEALEAIDRRLAAKHFELTDRRAAVDDRRAALEARQTALQNAQEEVRTAAATLEARLENSAAMTRADAAGQLLARIEGELAADHPGRVDRAVHSRVGDLHPAADGLLVTAIQRQDAANVDSAPRGAPLPLDGLPDQARERLLNALAVVAEDTFTELGVDEERQQATLRGLDPIGREVARQASIEVLDRRLSAEEVPPLLVRTRREVRKAIAELGERTLWEMGIDGRPEIAELLGTLHYRFSYGQNALLHCRETGDLCSALAAELGLDPAESRRAGLFHDIGKAVDHDVEGSHAIIGGEMLSILGVDPEIVHAVKAHHFDEEPATDLAMLTICADAISASRPGARRDTLTTYIQRLDQLQQIATRHRGVERAFPMQAGREVRIAVRPEQVADDQVAQLCAEIAREIEAEMQYPGMIKVTVIRETSAIATAS